MMGAMRSMAIIVVCGWLASGSVFGQVPNRDWLVDPAPYRADFAIEKGRARLSNGLITREFVVDPSFATVAIDRIPGNVALLRTTKPEARLRIDGADVLIGALEGTAIGNFLDAAAIDALKPAVDSLRAVDHRVGPIRERFAWNPRKEWISRPAVWPPAGRHLEVEYRGDGRWRGLEVVVHHECYDGMPLLSKWITVRNRTGRSVRLEAVTSEILGFVEAETEVELPERLRYPDVHVESDATGFIRKDDPWRKPSVRWLPDPTYGTQVNYALGAPCLLESSLPFGPDLALADGADFESHRTWVLPFDGGDSVRRSLTLARFYRTVAPWVQENPLIFHASRSDPEGVRAAVEQARAVGFEMVIMTFGSGFDAESRDPKYRETFKSLAQEAASKGVALGGYSLLASRSVGAETDVVDPRTGKPGGAFFGASPCLASAWGTSYIDDLKAFYATAGLSVLEHDGSYPGDLCGSTTHPGHRGHGDSYWMQRRAITEFYRWCRGEGIYLNVPDWYFMHGASKTGMGYRETNWSLPRERQEIIERQNIVDGVRTKAPTMGWMFVPLMEYHGGGPAATIEPLSEHIDHYRRRLRNLLGAGVQACWRGPRLWDGDAVRTMVGAEVAWFKKHRRILESDIVPIRRADGRSVDGWVHVDPRGDDVALAMFFNPLDEATESDVEIPLVYAGLSGEIRVSVDDGPWVVARTDGQSKLSMKLAIPARSSKSVIVRRS